MIKVENKLPEQGEIVVAYLDGGGYIFARYDRVLTWSGFKVKFMNLIRSGTWRNDVIGWAPIPCADNHYRSDLVRRACVKGYNFTWDQLHEFYGGATEDYKLEKWQALQQDFSKWFCSLDSESAERFVEDL